MNIIGHIGKERDDILIGDKLALKMERKGVHNEVTWMRFVNNIWIDYDRVQTEAHTITEYLLNEVEKIHAKEPLCQLQK